MRKIILIATLGLLTLGAKAQKKIYLNDEKVLVLDSNLTVQVEVLYSIAEKDSIQTQWMINGDQSVMFRKYDKELSKFTEWITLDEKSPKEYTLNGAKYYIKPTIKLNEVSK